MSLDLTRDALRTVNYAVEQLSRRELELRLPELELQPQVVALVLCADLIQEEREQGRLGLLRVQSLYGIAPVLLAALGWRLVTLWAVASVATSPALLLDPGSTFGTFCQWIAVLGTFCLTWVFLGGLLSFLPISGATSTLAALGVWLTLTFVVPAGLVAVANSDSPTPSRLKSIVTIRDAQHESEDHEQEHWLRLGTQHTLKYQPTCLLSGPQASSRGFLSRSWL